MLVYEGSCLSEQAIYRWHSVSSVGR